MSWWQFGHSATAIFILDAIWRNFAQPHAVVIHFQEFAERSSCREERELLG